MRLYVQATQEVEEQQDVLLHLPDTSLSAHQEHAFLQDQGFHEELDGLESTVIREKKLNHFVIFCNCLSNPQPNQRYKGPFQDGLIPCIIRH